MVRKCILQPMLSDIGKYRKKSNEIQLQLPDMKSIFPVTITLSENVFEFLSNLLHTKKIMSKYFPPQKKCNQLLE